MSTEATRPQHTPVAYLAALLEADVHERAERREQRRVIDAGRQNDLGVCELGLDHGLSSRAEGADTHSHQWEKTWPPGGEN